MNGLYVENILVRSNDDIYVPFEYELRETIPKEKINKNIIIDSRSEKILLEEIYKKGIEVLIYNTTRHKVINIYQYFEDIMGISKTILSINKIKKICYILIIIKYVFKKLNIKIDIRYLINNLTNDNFIQFSDISNIILMNESISKINTTQITSEQYSKMKNKLQNFETINEKKEILKSFIIMFGNEIISI